MVNGNCAVVGCTSSKYQLRLWGEKICEQHPGALKKECQCSPPFRLFSFPSIKRNMSKRKEWIRLINRTTKKKTCWNPGQSDMVCSFHFVDGEPSFKNPNPTLNLGYEKPPKRPRRKIARQDLDLPMARTECDAAVLCDHVYASEKQPCAACIDKNQVIFSMANEIMRLNKEKENLKGDFDELCEEVQSLKLKKNTRKPFSAVSIKSDLKMKFYTGIQSVAVFNAIFLLIKPYVPKLVFWRGKKVFSSAVTKKYTTKPHKLCYRDQFLLVLMRLRLGLLVHDLADRFQISTCICSNIFSTWVRFLSKCLGNALIVWLPKEVIMSHIPQCFKGYYRNTRCIIDCTEVFIERPKSLDVQAATWSEYKRHNTFKVLVAVSPAGYIMYLSDCYGGRTTDRFICQNSGIYNFLEYGDVVMADRGFQIKEDLLHHYCHLAVPPGARAKAQMTATECKKTKEVANVRIHVERAINRLKAFRILKNTFSLTMLPLADDIVRTCASVCNIQPLLIKK